jgi:hypothetical protein
MPNTPDGRYDTTKPWQNKPGMVRDDEADPYNLRYDYLGPHGSRDEAVISQAIASVTTPAQFLQDIVRPPLPQVQLFRSRFGYRSRQIGIADIMDVDEIYAEPRTDLSGGIGGYEGTSRNSSGNASY